MKRYSLMLAALALMLVSCFRNEHPVAPEYSSQNYLIDPDGGIKTGGVRMIEISTEHGSFNVWTKRIGNNPSTRILLLNGGPGCTHEYFECFESYLPAEGVEFIYYDQLGCGNSENPNDSVFWDLDRFVSEVEQVRKALNLDASNFYLLGHSWGGILAMEYAMQHQHNLKGLIISNMMSSCPKYGQYADEVLAAGMDPAVLKEIRSIEASGQFNDPRYMELLMPHFYQKHICRIPLDQWPEPMVRSFSKINQQLYVVMQGPSEFGIAGRLANWDRSGDLHTLTIPVLTIGATYDTMDPEHMKWMSEQIPGGSHHLCPNGSHMCFYDDQKSYFDGLMQFIRKVEGKTSK